MEIQFVKHVDCSDELLNRICLLKQQHWNYSMDMQQEWIRKNIGPDDMHVVIFDSNKLLAYSNLIYVTSWVNTEKRRFIGVGNVCVDGQFQHLKLGYLLMASIRYYSTKINCPGILFCKNSLVRFYEKCGWIKYHGVAFVREDYLDCSIMTLAPLTCEKIVFDQNF